MANEPVDPWARFNPQPLVQPAAEPEAPPALRPAVPATEAASAAPAAPAAPVDPNDPWARFNPTPAPPGLLSRLGTGLAKAGTAIKNAVVGQNEFDYPELTADPPNGLDMGALLRARNEDAMLDVLRKQLREDGGGLASAIKGDPLNARRDKYGNIVVSLQGKNYYLNRGGISNRDIDELVRDTLITAPLSAAAGVVTKAAALPFRAAAQGIAGAAGSFGSDVVSRGAGSEQSVDPFAMVASALGGMGGEMLGSLGTAIINKIKNAPGKFVTPAGQLTPAGEELFVKAGIDPADVTKSIADEFARRARATGPTVATAKEVAADEFGVPLTRGQATGDFDQIAFENAAKAGARGEVAGDIVRDQYGRQQTAIDAAKARISNEVAPQLPGVNQQDAADVVRGGVRMREEAHGEMVDAAWKQARELGKGVYIPKGSIKELPQVAKDALRSDPRYYTPDDSTRYPVTLEVKKLFDKWGSLDIGEITTKSGTGVTPTGVALELMDEFRKMLSGKGGLLSEAQGGDRQRVSAMAKAFNSWLDGVADEALMSGAGPQALQQFKNARAASAKHFSLFAENNTLGKTKDKAGQVLERMINDDVTPTEVANWVWGKGRIGESGDAYRLVKRLGDIFPKDSPEWEALRRGMWERMTSEAEGKIQPGAQALSQNILEFANGRGRAVAQELFSGDELAKMRRFAATLKNTLPPADATNPSKSGYELARAIGGASTATSSLPIRLFVRFQDSTRNIGPAGRALTTGGGAPVVRTPPSVVVPASSAAGAGEFYQDQNQ